MLIDRLNALKNLTYQERNLLKYINENPEALLHMSVTELAEKSYTSTATVTRFVQKAGLNGFSQMKTIYSLQYSEMLNRKNMIKKEPFSSNSSMDDIFRTLPVIYEKNIEYYRSILSRDDLRQVVYEIKNSGCVEIYGSGSSYYIGQIMMQRFESLGYPCHAYDFVNYEHVKYVEKKNVVAFLLSFTGKNPFILSAADALSQNQVYKTVAISSDVEKSLREICDFFFPLSFVESEKELRSTLYFNAIMFIFDCILVSLISDVQEMKREQ